MQIAGLPSALVANHRAGGQPLSETPPELESLSLGEATPPGVYSKPEFAEAEQPETVSKPTGGGSTLSTISKVVAFGMAGLVGVTALTGCGGPPTTISTGEHAEAREALETRLAQIEESMSTSNKEEDAEKVTGQVIDAVVDYARATGQKGQGLIDDLADVMREHPAATIAVAFTVGTAAGIGLEKLGFTDGISNGLSAVKEFAEEHPIITGIAVAGVVAGTAYLVYTNYIAPQAEIPPAPEGEHAEAMEQTFAELEAELKNHEGDPQAKAEEVNRTLGEKLKDYAQATGRSAAEVANDVKAWSYEHPLVATSIVMAAGVGTGVVLERAGVPDTVAGWVGSAIDSSGDGLGAVGDWIGEHPVIAGTVAAGVAVGAGYLIYTSMSGS